MADEPRQHRPVHFVTEQEMELVIVSYLREAPNSMDDVRGISQHWFARQRIQVELPVLQRVLARLVDAGTMEVVGETRQCYRLKRADPPAGDADVKS